jgi:protease I
MRDNAVTKNGLKGRRIAALVADGYEKVELALPMRALQLVGAKVDVISLRRGRIRGVNLHEPASRVHVTKTVHEANPADYDGLLLPGGFISPDLLRQSSRARFRVGVRCGWQADRNVVSRALGSRFCRSVEWKDRDIVAGNP